MEPSRQRYTGRVPTQTNILNFNSHHPLNHKVGVARILLYRKENIASEDMDKTKEEKHIYSALFLNNYPKWAVDRAKQQIENQYENKSKS